MKNKKIVIHVGLQKTATTFLQNEYFPNLADCTYIGRPYTQINKAFNLLQYADDSIFSLTKFQKEIDKIIDYSEKDHSILISDELFNGYTFYNFLNRTMIAERLSKAIPEAEIILFIRNQNDLILSLYNQYIKIGWYSDSLNKNFVHIPGEGVELNSWINGDRDWNIDKRFINHRSLFNIYHFKYSYMIEMYKKLFKNVHIFLYEDFKKNPNDNLNRIDSILGIKTSTENIRSAIKDKKVNKSLDHQRLNERIITNKLNQIFPNKSLTSRLSKKALSKVLSLGKNKISQSNFDYLVGIFEFANIYEDNVEVNNKWSLGMENYSDVYFKNIDSTLNMK